MEVYWDLDSFRLFPYRNAQSCYVGPVTLKKLGKALPLSIGSSSFRVRLEVLENFVIINNNKTSVQEGQTERD
jgi:hypothetical protein